jgi:predicted DNA-binding WGR domain protein
MSFVPAPFSASGLAETQVEPIVETRWETATRYYAVVLQQDLLGDWVLTVARGGKRNRLGAVKHKMVSSRVAGELEIEKLDRRRRARGYVVAQ